MRLRQKTSWDQERGNAAPNSGSVCLGEAPPSSQRGRQCVHALVGLSLVVLAFACLVPLCGCRPKKKQTPTLVVSVSSEPAGAEAKFNDRPAGKTPFRVRVRKARHMVEIALDGYETVWHPVPVDAGEEYEIDVELRPVSAAVIIESSPPGSSLRLDGVDKGGTPLFIQALPVGRHEGELTCAGYATKRFFFKIEDARPRRIQNALESVMCEIEVWTQPGGADVELDGKLIGRSPEDGLSALVVPDMVAGEFNLTVRKNGYKDLTQPVVLQKNERKVVRIGPLQELPGSIQVVSDPPKARVYDRGGELLGSTPLTLEKLPPGEISFRVEQEGFLPQEKTVQVSPGLHKQVQFRLPRFYGGVAFTTEPPGCVVMIDDRKVGRTTPSENPNVSRLFEYSELTPGVHELRLIRPEYERTGRRFLAPEGKTQRLGNIRLVKRWLPTHEVKTTGGNLYRGVVLTTDKDGSIVFQPAAKITVRYQPNELEYCRPLKSPAP